MGARNRIGIGLSYRPARLHRLAELVPWNRFLGSINVKYGLRTIVHSFLYRVIYKTEVQRSCTVG